MDWDALSAIAALIGGAGVVATLIYLAIEIRQNTRAVRSASYQSFTDSINIPNRMCCEDAELRDLLRWTAIRQWWHANTFGFLPEFDSYVEKIIAEVEGEDAGWFASGTGS